MIDARPMTPDELRTARAALGLSAAAFADLLGVAEGRTVRRWEADDSPIPGPVAVLIRVLMRYAKVRADLGLTLTRRRAAD